VGSNDHTQDRQTERRWDNEIRENESNAFRLQISYTHDVRDQECFSQGLQPLRKGGDVLKHQKAHEKE